MCLRADLLFQWIRRHSASSVNSKCAESARLVAQAILAALIKLVDLRNSTNSVGLARPTGKVLLAHLADLARWVDSVHWKDSICLEYLSIELHCHLVQIGLHDLPSAVHNVWIRYAFGTMTSWVFEVQRMAQRKRRNWRPGCHDERLVVAWQPLMVTDGIHLQLVQLERFPGSIFLLDKLPPGSTI